MNYPSKVTITEVGPRDGLQNEDRVLRVEEKVELINRLVRAGVTRIEVGAFVSPRAIPQMADTAEVFGRLSPKQGVTYIGLVPNEIGAENAIKAGAQELATFMSASEGHNRANVNRTIEESLDHMEGIAAIAAKARIPWTGYVSTVFGCPYDGRVPVENVIRIAARLRQLGATAVSLGDTIGAANPLQVSETLSRLRAALGDVKLRLHFHDTRGTGLANVLAALAEGIDAFDGSIGGLGGCPYAPGAAGNIATEDLVYMLRRMGIETGINLEALTDVARWAEGLMDRRLPGRVKDAGAAAMASFA